MEKHSLKSDARLNSHFSTLRTSTLTETLKRTAGNWQVYAAVTGAAMATATSASAGTIVYDNTSVTASVASLGAAAEVTGATNVGVLAPNRFFGIGVGQNSNEGYPLGAAFIQNPGGAFGFITAAGFVKKLASGAAISAGDAFNQATTGFGVGHQGAWAGGWAAAQTGFAGFSFSNPNTSQKDYGWVRLEYTDGTNGLPNSITAIDWAYDSSGAAITAGEGAGTPEPSTTALAILAAGAAGVAALRRRRNASA